MIINVGPDLLPAPKGEGSPKGNRLLPRLTTVSSPSVGVIGLGQSNPQTNGKIERFLGLMKQKLHLFESLEEFVYYCNYVKPYMSLNFDELDTPYQAFLRKVHAGRIFEYRKWLFEE